VTGVVGARGAARIVDEHTDPLPNHAKPEKEKTAEGPPGDAPAVDPEIQSN
jgi:hypothetical protein